MLRRLSRATRSIWNVERVCTPPYDQFVGTASSAKILASTTVSREPVSQELRRLEADGVIEHIDASPWTSNIVTAKKRYGSLRLCVNLTEVNKALIPERYPLPIMAELTENLSCCTIFSKIDLL